MMGTIYRQFTPFIRISYLLTDVIVLLPPSRCHMVFWTPWYIDPWDTKGVTRNRKSKKDRHHNGQNKKVQRDKPRSTKHYTEKLSNTNPTKYRGWIHVFRKNLNMERVTNDISKIVAFYKYTVWCHNNE